MPPTRMFCMPRLVRRPSTIMSVSPGVACRADAAQELLHPGQAFRRRIDRAPESTGALCWPGGERPQGHDQVLQFSTGRPLSMPTHAARQRRRPAFGRAGQHDVLGFGIVEHVADAGQPGEILHLFGRRLSLCRRAARTAASSRLSETLRSLLALATFGIQAWRVASAIRCLVSWPVGSAKCCIRSTPSASTITPLAPLTPPPCANAADRALRSACAGRLQRPQRRHQQNAQAATKPRCTASTCLSSPTREERVPETLPPLRSRRGCRGWKR